VTETKVLSPSPSRVFRIALIGNPNTGKSTVFNALAGMQVKTANYPGVTIEKKTGRYRYGEQVIELLDLPGTYSLAPRAPDELVTVDVLTGVTSIEEPIDGILCVVNATLLHRNLFLLSQLLELGKPVILLVNMIDSAEARGISIDAERLSAQLGIPVVLAAAAKKRGIEEVRRAIQAILSTPPSRHAALPLPPRFYQVREQLSSRLAAISQQTPEAKTKTKKNFSREGADSPNYYLLGRAILDGAGLAENKIANSWGPSAVPLLHEAREQLTGELGSLIDLECNSRYSWAATMLQGVIQQSAEGDESRTEWLDRFLTHRVFGFLFFLLLMFAIFQTIYSLAQYPMGACEEGQQWLSSLLEQWLSPGILRSLLIDGVVAGVGSVLIFVPQIALLFFFIAILEDCGYMARAAFLVDRVMGFFGLSGKSFLPLMSSFACAVPGVMATRVIENARDRLTTILVAPLMSCSARLPVYLLMIGAFIPATTYAGGFLTLRGLVLMAAYLVGISVAVPVAWLLKKTFLRGETAPFVLEMPDYQWPSVPVLFQRVYQSCQAFIVRAGTLIFSASVLIWAAGYFPGDHSEQFRLMEEIERSEGNRSRAEVAGLESRLNAESGRLLEASFLGQGGHFIEPIVRPLGWDWRIGVGAIASFPAREVIISTLATIYSLGGQIDEDNQSLVDAMRASKWPDGRPVFTVPVALSIIVFFALCAQCVSTLLVIKRETNSWGWPLFSFGYMTALAYLGALIVYQCGTRLPI